MHYAKGYGPSLGYTEYILLSHACRLIYFRVHKCGSSSVRKFLIQPRTGHPDGFCPDLRVYRSRRNYGYDDGAPPGWDLDAALAGERVPWIGDPGRVSEPYFLFGLVREPVSRFMSTYNFIRTESLSGARPFVQRPAEGWTKRHDAGGYEPAEARMVHLRNVLRDLPGALSCRQGVKDLKGAGNDHFQRSVNFIQDEYGRSYALDYAGHLEDGLLPTYNRLRGWLCQVSATSNVQLQMSGEQWDREVNLRANKRSNTWPWEVKRSELSVSDVRQICRAYAQDYECFGYALPAECARDV